MLNYGDLLHQSRLAFADGQFLLAHYALMTAMYLAFGEGSTRGVRRALRQAVQQELTLAQAGVPQAHREMAHSARSCAELLLSRLELAEHTAAIQTLDGAPRPSWTSRGEPDTEIGA